MGASHYKSGKPCQDYSISYTSDDKDVNIAIVCDGHGGNTYVRSDKGSMYAAQISLEVIKEFISNVDATLFLDKKGAVTARPDEGNTLFGRKPETVNLNDPNLTESQVEQLKQNKLFDEQVADIKEQDQAFNTMFVCIYERWLNAINEDADKYPFTADEKMHLGGKSLVKAYGTTLIAFARTPLYWFAFQIGDGKCLTCDRNMVWTEPIPWDCRCFLNVTTSLCSSNPIPEFRFAFNGEGVFPAAIIMGSDGIDDSWLTMPNLQNFYSQLLNTFATEGKEITIKELDEYLPKLSEKGSRDDMSIAGIVDTEAIKEIPKLKKLDEELKAIEREKEKRQKVLGEVMNSIADLQLKINQDNGFISNIKIEIERIMVSLQKLQKEKDIKNSEYDNKLSESNEQKNDLAVLEQKLASEKETDIQLNTLEERQKSTIINSRQEIVELNSKADIVEFEQWSIRKTAIEIELKNKIEEKRKHASELMENSSKEWMERLESTDKDNIGENTEPDENN